MAWMRMMGRESVEYHRKTVIERGDDYPGRALAYYASRGETPLVWGGSGAVGLGVAGTATAEEYEAVFGRGGARQPQSGERLAVTSRPGMEMVISAHKSVAELGVIGRSIPATPRPGPGILARMIICCWQTWSGCSTSGAGGRRRTRRCGVSICTRRP